MTFMNATLIFRFASNGHQTQVLYGIIGKSSQKQQIRSPKYEILTIFRITIHNASWDYEGSESRHGTRVTSLAEKPYFDPKSPTRREKLGLLTPGEL